jgi:hypothetical protein
MAVAALFAADNADSFNVASCLRLQPIEHERSSTAFEQPPCASVETSEWTRLLARSVR